MDAQEQRALPAVLAMQESGVCIDEEHWKVLAQEARQEARRLHGQLNEQAPRCFSTRDMGRSTWSWESPKQVAEALRDLGCDLEVRYPGGPDLSDEAIARFPVPFVDLILRYRSSSRAATEATDRWLGVIRDGRVFTRWSAFDTADGELGCEWPDIRVMPRAFRSAVRAAEGRVLVVGRLPHLLLRAAAKLADDENLSGCLGLPDVGAALAAKLELEDSQLARLVVEHLALGETDTTVRQHARLRLGAIVSDSGAHHRRQAFARAFPGLAAWQKQQLAGRPREVTSLAGRKRQLADRATQAERLGAPVRMSVADILKGALANVADRASYCPGAVPVLVADNEVVLEVPADQAADAERWLKGCLQDAAQPLLAPVPVVVEVRSSPTWN